jgi:hypothetical protein
MILFEILELLELAGRVNEIVKVLLFTSTGKTNLTLTAQ